MIELEPERKVVATVLAIDLGTSGPKVALYDSRCSLLCEAFSPVETRLTEDGGAEQDPEAWWQALVQNCRSLRSRHPEAFQQVAWVACTGQWSGTVPLDREGRVLHPCITWMDSRGAEEVRSLMKGRPAVSGYGLFRVLRWIRLTGGAPSLSGKDPLGHILWLKKNKPEIYNATATFLEPVDYLNFRLTGRRCASFDSITVHWITDNRRPHAITYHPGLIRRVGLDASKLPELVATGSWVGALSSQAADALGLPAGARVLTACGDIHSAAVGSGATDDWVPHFYIGTSSWLIAHVPRKITDLSHNMGALPAALPGRYILASEQETAGKCLQFVRDNLLFDDQGFERDGIPENFYQQWDTIASQSPPGSRGLIFFPWLNGERTPYEDHYMRGGFFNIHLRHRQPDFLRSVLEGVALNCRLILEALQRHAPQPINRVHMIGGGAQSTLWCRIAADVLNVRIHQMADPQQCNTRGAAMLALLAAGLIRREALSRLAPVENIFDPLAENMAVYDKLYSVFKQFYARNKKLWHRLNS
jgi:xylulokinase